MAYEFAEPMPSPLGVIIRLFVVEVTQALDESVEYPRRIAIVVKWSWLLSGLGYQHPIPPAEVSKLDPERLKQEAMKMLQWLGGFVQKYRV